MRWKLADLARISDEQYDSAKRILKTGHLFAIDLLAMSVLNRSLDVIDAFLTAFDRWNVAVASALVRFQIDNVMRMHFFAVSDESRAILAHLADDLPLKDFFLPATLIDRVPISTFGKRPKCTDGVLLALATPEHDWVAGAYRTASGWIHHSSAHLLTTWHSSGGTISGHIPVDIDQFEPEFLEPLLDTMGLASSTLTRYAVGLAAAKEEWAGPDQTAG